MSKKLGKKKISLKKQIIKAVDKLTIMLKQRLKAKVEKLCKFTTINEQTNENTHQRSKKNHDENKSVGGE